MTNLRTDPGLPWVSVEERLPEPDDECLLLEDGKHKSIGYYAHTGDWVESAEDRLIHNVTHWLPLSAIPLPGAGEWIEAGQIVGDTHEGHMALYMTNGLPLAGDDAGMMLFEAIGTPGLYRVLLQRIEEGE